jgi:very-short-patch-repair endonuclease
MGKSSAFQRREDMKEIIEIPESVREFQDKCSQIVGRHAEEQFSIDIFNRVQDHDLNSPIEQMFLSAFEALRMINGFPEYEETMFDGRSESFGTIISCQHKIDKYRVDFFISHKSASMARENKPAIMIVVECDGHDFHDKNEIQRRYEKKRDRHMQKLGFRVFRYTGSEIVKDPFVPAAECLSFATGDDFEEMLIIAKEYFEQEQEPSA